MFRTFFKHVIYEYCIELAFDNLRKNFPQSKSKFIQGQKFQAIEFEVDDIWWGIEEVEVLYCDDKVLILSYASGEAHVPDGHLDLCQFKNDTLWEEVGRYGGDTDDVFISFINHFGGTQVFAIEELKDVDYV